MCKLILLLRSTLARDLRARIKVNPKLYLTSIVPTMSYFNVSHQHLSACEQRFISAHFKEEKVSTEVVEFYYKEDLSIQCSPVTENILPYY